MNHKLHPDMIEATRLTRAGRLAEATALLQRILRGRLRDEPASDTTSSIARDASAERTAHIIDMVPEAVEVTEHRPSSPGGPAFGVGTDSRLPNRTDGAARPNVPGALRRFLERVNRIGTGRIDTGPGTGGLAQPSPASARDITPTGGQFVAGSYSNQAGSRAYKLYIPSGYRGQAVPLIVMLHGCTQSPDDFAAGTCMNALAEERTCLVAYPAQAASANSSKCWNWFRPGDQRRDEGEPSLVAGITRQIMDDYAVDPQRVYVAGLSAGAAAAVTMGMTYPDLYAAVGVHSGLASGAATDVPSAFAAMRQGGAVGGRSGSAFSAEGRRRIVPTIVFHGDQDRTVHPSNGDQVIAQARAGTAMELQTRVERGQVPGGHAYSRILHADTRGRAILEHWLIHGGGHAWSGGNAIGSYTDPRGPDAAREMLRFFLDQE
ncbi:extracellular catalytic domain type 1 short-chain-length polyhydroxyalkanoate depolymerase [Rhodospirillaceae bacterium SYSU D60014]|uniref:extracellular catalytic domain type 1 short-chain-length polyhydroxyalkanoate depolymerase n=1 Tax=Virgifigura deserti TaxID=2268457 RepID=UPI000E66DF59